MPCPNITGMIESRPHMSGGNFGGSLLTANGCFTFGRRTGTNDDAGVMEQGKYKRDRTQINASRSSGIYSKSGTVQPTSLRVISIVRT